MLTEEERAVLAFERQWWRYAATKEDAIRVKFDMNATSYYQKLNMVLAKPEAMEEDPTLVRRLLRIADSRARARRQRKH